MSTNIFISTSQTILHISLHPISCAKLLGDWKMFSLSNRISRVKFSLTVVKQYRWEPRGKTEMLILCSRLDEDLCYMYLCLDWYLVSQWSLHLCSTGEYIVLYGWQTWDLQPWVKVRGMGLEDIPNEEIISQIVWFQGETLAYLHTKSIMTNI